VVLTWEVDDGVPVAGRHYPRDLAEFNRWFRSEASAAKYLTDVRFRHGFACPRCGVEVARSNESRWWCRDCRRWFTLTTGTLLERTKVPLATWLVVAWHLVQTKIGVSALSVQRITGVNYDTAWLLLQKMRAAMNQDERKKLSGDVEFDETYVGGVELGAGGRSRGKRSPVAVACEVVSPKAMGRIRLARLPDASALAIADFLERNVEPGSVLLCDDWASYRPALSELRARGLHYTAKTTTLSKTESRAHLIHPHVHRVASLLKRWLLGTHQGAVRGQHLDAYLDEFVFRFNRRNSRNRGLIFWRLVCSLMETRAPVTNQQLRQQRSEQVVVDEAHAIRVTTRRNTNKAERRRTIRRVEAEEQGRSVRPYHRKARGEDETSP
jgi:transposase-like protein